MVWALEVERYKDVIGLSHSKWVTLLDDNTLETRRVPADSVKKGMLMGVEVENLILIQGELMDKYKIAEGKAIEDSSINNPFDYLEKFTLATFRGSMVIRYNTSTKKLEVNAIQRERDKSIIGKYFSYCRESTGDAIERFKDELETGLAKRLMMKQDIIGGTLNLVSKGDDTVLMGGINGPIDDYNMELVIPKGVTVVNANSIKNVKSTTFSDSVHKFTGNGTIYCSRIYNLPTSVEVDSNFKISGSLNDNEEQPLVVPEVNGWRPTQSYLKGINAKKVIYADPSEKKVYEDAMFSGNYYVEAVALMGKGPMIIGERQFDGCGDLKAIVTPHGKIVAVKRRGLAYCSVLSNIDLSDCRLLEEEALCGMFNSGEEGKALALTFNRTIKVCKGALTCKLAFVEFWGEDIELERGAFSNYGDVNVGYRTGKVRDKLRQYIEENGRWDGKMNLYKVQ